MRSERLIVNPSGVNNLSHLKRPFSINFKNLLSVISLSIRETNIFFLKSLIKILWLTLSKAPFMSPSIAVVIPCFSMSILFNASSGLLNGLKPKLSSYSWKVGS